jgi:hypothetical protein
MKRLTPYILIVAILVPVSTSAQSTAKNPKAAAFLSLLVPGLGELYAGGPRSGRFFLFTEATLWSGLILFEHLETTRRKNFRSYAATHAGLNTNGKSDTYLEEVTTYESIYARNAHERFVGGENATFLDETADNLWEWDTATSRSEFRVLRGKANSARQKGLLFVGGLIFNRFASAINASHIARKTLPHPVTLQLLPAPNRGMHASLTTTF